MDVGGKYTSEQAIRWLHEAWVAFLVLLQTAMWPGANHLAYTGLFPLPPSVCLHCVICEPFSAGTVLKCMSLSAAPPTIRP